MGEEDVLRTGRAVLVREPRLNSRQGRLVLYSDRLVHVGVERGKAIERGNKAVTIVPIRLIQAVTTARKRERVNLVVGVPTGIDLRFRVFDDPVLWATEIEEVRAAQQPSPEDAQPLSGLQMSGRSRLPLFLGFAGVVVGLLFLLVGVVVPVAQRGDVTTTATVLDEQCTGSSCRVLVKYVAGPARTIEVGWMKHVPASNITFGNGVQTTKVLYQPSTPGRPQQPTDDIPIWLAIAFATLGAGFLAFGIYAFRVNHQLRSAEQEPSPRPG